MISMDIQNRIAIPQSVREVTALDFSKEIRFYIKDKENNLLLVLSNELNLDFPCFGKARIDEKFRITLPKELRKYLNITTENKLLIYSLKGELTVERL